MKTKNILLFFILIITISSSCKKDEIVTENNKLLKSMILETYETVTYNFEYSDSILTTVTSTSELGGPRDIYYDFFSDNMLQKITNPNSDEDIIISFEKQAGLLIQNPGWDIDDSIVYILNNNKVVNIEGYNSEGYDPSYYNELPDYTYDISWENGNISNLSYIEYNPDRTINYEYGSQFTYDDKKNPLNFIPGFIDIDHYFKFNNPYQGRKMGAINNILTEIRGLFTIRFTYTYEDDYPKTLKITLEEKGIGEIGVLADIVFEYY